MDKNNEYWVLASLAAFITPLIARIFKMGFWETVFAVLLAGLGIAFIVWAIRIKIKKKLCALITIDNPIGDKCNVSVLLWNSAIIREVFYSDFERHGLRIVTNSDTVISNLKTKEITSKNFVAENIEDSIKNLAIIPMGNIKGKTLIEINFTVVNKVVNNESRIIILPSSAELPSNRFIQKPFVDFQYERKKLNILEVQYDIIKQTAHWVFSIFAIFVTLLMVFLFARFYLQTLPIIFAEIFQIVLICLLFVAFALIPFIVIGESVRPFVAKHLKSKQKNNAGGRN